VHGDDGFEGAADIRAFYRGVDAHEDGKKSWTRDLDPSV
jgi:hypothetical protein